MYLCKTGKFFFILGVEVFVYVMCTDHRWKSLPTQACQIRKLRENDFIIIPKDALCKIKKKKYKQNETVYKKASWRHSATFWLDTHIYLNLILAENTKESLKHKFINIAIKQQTIPLYKKLFKLHRKPTKKKEGRNEKMQENNVAVLTYGVHYNTLALSGIIALTKICWDLHASSGLKQNHRVQMRQQQKVLITKIERANSKSIGMHITKSQKMETISGSYYRNQRNFISNGEQRSNSEARIGNE